MPLEFVSNEEIVRQARRNLNQASWDYLAGGSESETTLRRNRLAFDRLAFRPRVGVDVSKIDTSSTFLGQPMRIPVMFAPMGTMQSFYPAGASAAAQAAAEFGTLQVVSSVAGEDLEVTAAASSAPKIFQLYVRGDLRWVKDMIDRVKASGYMGFCLTVDVAIYSRRERPILGRTVAPRARAANEVRYLAMLTWDVMDQIKAMSDPLPFMIKGIATAEDAKIAIDHGVDVIWVSNHGGRQLDHGLGTMDMLPEIVEAVGGRARILIDGGVQRATDVLKALALGADAVAIGKLVGWGLGAAGKEGVVRMMELLEDEMISAMGLLGVTSVDQLGPGYIRKAQPVTQPHEMSAWVNMPGGRIL